MRALILLAAALLHSGAAYAQPVTMPGYTIPCNASVIYDAAATGATKLVTAATGKQIYVCGYVITAGGTSSVGLVSGTGTNCGTNTVKLTPAYPLLAQGQVHDVADVWRGMATLGDLCLNSSAAVAVQAVVYYGQY